MSAELLKASDQEPARCWFVLKTKPHAEESVASLLRINGIEFYFPQTRRWKPPRSQWRLEPLFRGYIFVRLNVASSQWLAVRSAPGVAYALGNGGRPTPVQDSIIYEIQQRLDACGGVWEPHLRRGDRVLIKDGPFRGLDAIFDAQLTGAARSRVLLSLLGRQTPVEVWTHALHATRR